MHNVSIIIPTYNTSKYICEAIDSVLAQTYDDFEIIVIDDGSTDDTLEVLKQYGNKIKYIYKENKGVAAARNRGILESRGNYIALLDADDIWLPEKLKQQMDIAEKFPEVGLFFSDAEVFNSKGIVRKSFRPSHISEHEIGSYKYKMASAIFNDGSIINAYIYKDLIMGNMITTSTVLIRKECIISIDNFDENLSVVDDYDMWIRIAKKHPISYLNKVTIKYRLRDDSISGNVNLRGFIYKSYDAQVLEKELCSCESLLKPLIKKRILDSYKTAIWGYFNLKELSEVRALCFRSLRYNIFQFKLYIYIFATFFPRGFIKSRTPLR